MERSDYEEPRCPMDNSMWVKKESRPIPITRVIAKEDEYLSKNDYASAKRHLLYWWDEAEKGRDRQGLMALSNELMGLHRKLGEGEKAREYAGLALALTKELELQDTVAGATSFLNAGTVYKAFGEPKRSLECFEQARAIYETLLNKNDSRKAGLYNNMALTFVDLKRFEEARALYRDALSITSENASMDEAITWLNLADCAAAEKGTEEAEEDISEYLSKAQAILDAVPLEEQNGYYAFVCEKCAPVFDYYGYFMFAKKLSSRAAAIYHASEPYL